MDMKHECICCSQPCVCGLHVPEPFQLLLAANEDAATALNADKDPKDELLEGDSTEQKASSATADTKVSSRFRIEVASRPLDINYPQQDEMQPPDLTSKQHPANNTETGKLQLTGSKRQKVASFQMPLVDDYDSLREGDSEIAGAYCEAQLRDDLVEACRASNASAGAGENTQHGHLASALELIDDNDLDVNAADKSGQTPLIGAAMAGDSRLLAELVARGAELNGTDLDGHTALWHACQNGHDLAAATLLEFGASASVQPGENGGPSLLAVAVAGGHEGIVTLLLDFMAANEAAAIPRKRQLDSTHASPAPMLKGAAAVLRSQLNASLVKYAAEIDQGQLARVLDRCLVGQCAQNDDFTCDDPLYIPSHQRFDGGVPDALSNTLAAGVSPRAKATTSARSVAAALTAKAAAGALQQHTADTDSTSATDSTRSAASLATYLEVDRSHATGGHKSNDMESDVTGVPVWHQKPKWSVKDPATK